MTTENTDLITITLRTGQCFEHHPPKESFEKKFEFMNKILSTWTSSNKGILMLTYPVALYNIEDVSSIHFPDMVPIPDTTRFPIGFHPRK